MSVPSNVLWVLGAADPEMWVIKQLLEDFEQEWVQPEPDNPAKAYRLTREYLAEFNRPIILVECGIGLPHKAEELPVHAVVDHHHPAHERASWAGKDGWRASSLAQVAELLNYELSHAERLVGAVDHNLAETYSGLIGYHPDEVLEYRIDCISKGTGSPEQEVRRAVDRAVQAVTLVEELCLDPVHRAWFARDLTQTRHGVGYDLDYLAVVEAAVRIRKPVLFQTQDPGDRREKFVLTNAPPKMVEAFKDGWAKLAGLEGVYGVPARGFAGGYNPL